MNDEAIPPLQTVEIETIPDRTADAAVIWLHGLGADGHDFEPIVPELGLPDDFALRFVFPHADTRPVTVNGGAVQRAWYDIGMDFDRDFDEVGIRRSAEQVEALIAAERARGIAANRIVLAGFSQGGAMAYHVGLRHPEPLAGILVLSGYLLLSEQLGAEASDAQRSTPILQCHGMFDPVVPIPLAELGAAQVRDAGFPIDWKSYSVAHGLNLPEIADISAWLCDRLYHSPA